MKTQYIGYRIKEERRVNNWMQEFNENARKNYNPKLAQPKKITWVQQIVIWCKDLIKSIK